MPATKKRDAVLVSKGTLQMALATIEELHAGWAWEETLGDVAVKELRTALGKEAWHPPHGAGRRRR